MPTEREDKRPNAPSRGFVTLASKREKYYRYAYTMLQSYRLTTADPMPFAIVCDERNQYTEAFDEVILLDNLVGSSTDKLELLRCAPYDETIFIETDIIAYSDLNEYWRLFEGASDFSCFGNVLPMDDTEYCWFTPQGAGKYEDRLTYLLECNGGVCYYRRGPVCEEIYRIARDVVDHYDEFTFKIFKTPADEPAFAMGMALCGCKPVPRTARQYAFFGLTDFIQVDFFARKLIYDRSKRCQPGEMGHVEDGLIIHFGTNHTFSKMYLMESRKVLFQAKHGRPWNALEAFLNESYVDTYRYLRKTKRRVKNNLRKLVGKEAP